MMDTASAARAVDGRVVGRNVAFARVTTDSRALEPGDLFVALHGERFDGHDFVASAFEHGAAAALVANDRLGDLGGDLVAVDDPLAALGRLARHWRERFAIPVVVVVGSNGKTTVKEMLASILRAHFGADAVLATRGNLNNAIGLPLTLLALRAGHRVAAIELGMNHRGETATLAALAKPTVALINNAQREHQEFMRSTAEVAAEHADLVRALPRGGVAILNADDPHVALWREAAGPTRRVVDFALDHPAAVRGSHRPSAAGGIVEITTSAGAASVALAIPGRHNAANALAAAAAAMVVGVPLRRVVRGLEAFRPVGGRLVTRTLANRLTVVDDTYNANPDSVRAAIDVLAQARGTKWLVLGDMGEVGAQGPAFHREVGTYARERGIDRLLAAGSLAAEAAAAFGTASEAFATVEALVQRLHDAPPADATLLVKGSRFMRMERVVAALAGERADEAH